MTPRMNFLKILEQELAKPLPGFKLQEKLEPATRKQFSKYPKPEHAPRESAVLILLIPKQHDFEIVFIQRNLYDGVHSGQIAFPGGKMEKTDASHMHTALRETWEEIGVPAKDVIVLGHLSQLYIPPSNFNVQPVVGYCNYQPNFKADLSEVAEIFSVPLQEVLNPLNQKKEAITIHDGLKLEVPCYVFNGKIVWGATSMILSEFIEVATISSLQT